MEQSQLEKDLSGLIEYKINYRNELAKRRPRPDGIIKITDREIDILQNIECFIMVITANHARQIIERARKSFYNGKQAGIMEMKTGRNHDQFF